MAAIPTAKLSILYGGLGPAAPSLEVLLSRPGQGVIYLTIATALGQIKSFKTFHAAHMASTFFEFKEHSINVSTEDDFQKVQSILSEQAAEFPGRAAVLSKFIYARSHYKYPEMPKPDGIDDYDDDVEMKLD